MILSDTGIRAAIANGDLTLDPPPAPGCIQPCSIDVHLGPWFRWPSPDGAPDSDPVRGPVTVPHGRMILGHLVERVKLSNRVVVHIDGKSTVGRRGIAVHVTAGLIDPGFCGAITLELVNLSGHERVLTPGDLIAQLVVEPLDQPCARPYGSPGTGSRYQGQSGPTGPRHRT